jgi:hypothetical protein
MMGFVNIVDLFSKTTLIKFYGLQKFPNNSANYSSFHLPPFMHLCKNPKKVLARPKTKYQDYNSEI